MFKLTDYILVISPHAYYVRKGLSCTGNYCSLSGSLWSKAEALLPRTFKWNLTKAYLPPKITQLLLGAHFTVCHKAVEIGLKSSAALPLTLFSLNVSSVLPKGIIQSWVSSLLPPFLSQQNKTKQKNSSKNTELNTLLSSSSKEVFVPSLMWLSGESFALLTKGSWVWFWSRTHAFLAGSSQPGPWSGCNQLMCFNISVSLLFFKNQWKHILG